MTQEEEKQMRRIFPEGWEETDVPTFIRNRDFNEEMKLVEALERKAEEVGEEINN
jgi:hypothetical protein